MARDEKKMSRHKKMSSRGKKITSGTASVLLGTGIIMGANSRPVKASNSREDEITEVENADVLSSEKTKIDVKQRAADDVLEVTQKTDENTVQSASENIEQGSEKIDLEQDANEENTATSEMQITSDQQSTSNDAVENEEVSEDSQKVVDSSANIAEPETTVVQENVDISSEASSGEKEQLDTKQEKLELAAEAETQISKDVSDYQSFLDAIRDVNTNVINLTGNVDFSNATLKHGLTGITGKYETLNDQGIARELTINGNGNSLIMGDRYLEFTSKNQNDNKNWDITLKDLTLQTTSGNGPFKFANTNAEAGKNTITFDGVTTTTDSYEIMWYKSNSEQTANVKFKGNNTINSIIDGDTAALYAYSVEVLNGITTFNVINSDPANTGTNRSVILISETNAQAGKVIVDQGATLNINADSKVTVDGMDGSNSYGTMGIRFWSWADTADIDTAKTSVVQVAGDLNLNMGSGGSTAILASYVDVQSGGNVVIETLQNGDDTGTGLLTGAHTGTHFGAITGGMAASDSHAGIRIAKDGSLKIVRPAGLESTQPLISYGDIGVGIGKTFTIDVQDGGTLDLQDGAKNPQNWNFENDSSTTESNMPWTGLITMWGTSTTNVIKINNPKYVNLQRLGDQFGSLMRLEGTTNNVTINGEINDATTPLAQWDAGEKGDTPSYYWYIKDLANQNNWGTAANTFTKSGDDSKPASSKGSTTFLGSNGSVEMASNQAGTNSSKFNNGTIAQTSGEAANYQAPYLSQFLNHFSWWSSQRIAMGSALEDIVKPTDSQKYQPETQDVNGNINQTLDDLDAKDGIKDLISSDGTTTTDLTPIQSVTWYNSTTDADDWTNIMGNDIAVPTNPTGNLTVDTKSAWAKVTYADSSVDFVNIPLNISETASMADTYTPSYDPVEVEKGQTATADPTFTGADGSATAVPDGTTFTLGDTVPTGTTIDATTGTVTIGADAATGEYNIPVTVTYSDGSTEEVLVPVTVAEATTDADKYNPEGQDVTVEIGKTPEASAGIKNKGDLPEGTEYTWKEAPDTTTPGDTTETVIVTYPDKSTEEVEVPIHVKDPSTMTDADKYNPEGQDVTVETGKTPDPSEGIKNKGDLPEGTEYTWKETPDTTTPGDRTGTIVVTYPDGSTEEVPVTIHVKDPSTMTDADKYNPEGQDVTVETGKTPEASEGIKNKGDLPEGTEYTWKEAPDTTTPGDRTGTIVVTYPDGSMEEVPVTIHVKTPDTTPTTPTTPIPGNNGGDNTTATDPMPENNNGSNNSTSGNENNDENIDGSVTDENTGKNTDSMPNSKSTSSSNKVTNMNDNSVNSSNVANGSTDVNTVNAGNGNSEETLPQTSETNDNAGILGLVLANLAALLGVADRKKRRDKK